MADVVRQVAYYNLEVPHQPGEGARILSGLKKSRVNLLVFSGFPVGDGRAQLDLVPDDPAKLQKAAAKLGLSLWEPKKAFLVTGEDRIGAAADILGKLAKEGINITASQALCAGRKRWAMILWVAPADYDRASKLLKAKEK